MKLSEQQFQATFAEPMTRLQGSAPPFEFWSYFESIPATDFEGHNCSEGQVSYVWQSGNGQFQHVLVNSENKNIFMVLILNLAQRNVVGHRLLNLEREYGLA